MKATPFIAAAVLALGLTPAVHAQRYGYPRDDYGRRGGYDRWDNRRADVLAQEIDETASQIHYQAERNNRRPDRAEARALAALHELDEAASHFNAEIHRDWQNPRHTDADFTRLVRTFDLASDTLRSIEPRGYIDRGMDRIAYMLNDLSRFYGRTYDYRGHGWGRYGYDRDGYDRNRDGRRDRWDGDDHDGYRHR